MMIDGICDPRFARVRDAFASNFAQSLDHGGGVAVSAGYQIEDPLYAGRASTETFGHAGWGSAISFADVGADIGFGYVTNRMASFDGNDPRREALIDAVYDAL